MLWKAFYTREDTDEDPNEEIYKSNIDNGCGSASHPGRGRRNLALSLIHI